MTKAEELKTLDKIEALIRSAGEDSYISMTFAGIVDLCRENIANDFGNAPLADLQKAREDVKAKEQLAKTAFAELDSLKEDFDRLANDYRTAVDASEAARPYAVDALAEARSRLSKLEESDPDADILRTVRAFKRAENAVHLTHHVQEAAWSMPNVQLFQHHETTA